MLTIRQIKFFISFLLLGGTGVLLLLYSPTLPTGKELKQQTFTLISDIRAAKKQEVINHFETIQKQAQAIATDQQMLELFSQIEQQPYNHDIEFEIDKQYVTRYSNFYDILFVNPSGLIFHSVKKETDFRANIFVSEAANKNLAKTLRNSGTDGFVEYEYYPPSAEAAAFFVVRIKRQDNHMGWFVLQCETNRLNTILSDRKELGRTGEIYLVNSDKLMLTESRFMGDSTILRQKVDTIAVKEALLSKEDTKIIHDYRGVNVFSSYESFELFGASWIIIVEIDEDEVISEYYKQHQDYFVQEFIAYLTTQDRTSKPLLSTEGFTRKNVAMNEFAKAEFPFYLATEGVSTCTAITISYPERFGNMVHISPTDEIYIDNSLTKYFLKTHYHNFISELLEKITYFDIYPYELRKIQFVITAIHTDSIEKAIDGILEHNVTLANIKFMYNPHAQNASLLLAPPQFNTAVVWNGKETTTEYANQTESLESILKKIIHYDV